VILLDASVLTTALARSSLSRTRDQADHGSAGSQAGKVTLHPHDSAFANSHGLEQLIAQGETAVVRVHGGLSFGNRSLSTHSRRTSLTIPPTRPPAPPRGSGPSLARVSACYASGSES
jgi:hypothetical protein